MKTYGKGQRKVGKGKAQRQVATTAPEELQAHARKKGAKFKPLAESLRKQQSTGSEVDLFQIGYRTYQMFQEGELSIKEVADELKIFFGENLNDNLIWELTHIIQLNEKDGSVIDFQTFQILVESQCEVQQSLLKNENASK